MEHPGWLGFLGDSTTTQLYTRVSGCNLVTIVSKLGYFTYLGDLHPTYLYWGELIQWS